VGVFGLLFYQVNVYDPELAAACSHDVYLQVCGIDVKVDFIYDLSVKFAFPGVIYISVAKLLIVLYNRYLTGGA